MEAGREGNLVGLALKRAEGLMLVMDTPKGRGVFANQCIPSKTVLEVSPVLVLDPKENEEHVRKTDLYNYTYNWPNAPLHTTGRSESQPSTTQAIILGLGSMFNHSNRNQNVGFERDIKNLVITYTALRDIKAGEELCISYGARLTFKDTDAADMSDEDESEMLGRIELID